MVYMKLAVLPISADMSGEEPRDNGGHPILYGLALGSAMIPLRYDILILRFCEALLLFPFIYLFSCIHQLSGGLRRSIYSFLTALNIWPW